MFKSYSRFSSLVFAASFKNSRKKKKGRVLTLPFIWSGLRGSVAALDALWSSAALKTIQVFIHYRLVRADTNEQRKKEECLLFLLLGADYGARTRHLNLGKVALYQMS